MASAGKARVFDVEFAPETWLCLPLPAIAMIVERISLHNCGWSFLLSSTATSNTQHEFEAIIFLSH